MSREQQFKYKTAEISSDKDGDFIIDIRSTIVELVIFESLDKPYITGQLAVSDDAGIYDGIDFRGTHRFHVKMLSEIDDAESEDIVMDRVFLMNSIETIIKSSNAGNSSIYVFNLIEEHALLSKTKKISRSIKDNLRTEILKLCQNECGKNVDLSYASESVQSNFKGIIPYMHPLEAATWLTNKATTDTGMPYFLYGSMHDENLRLGSLDVMLQQEPWNKNIPFIFSPSNTQKQEDSRDPTLQYFQIQSMKTTKLHDTMKHLISGGIGSLYTVVDLNTGNTTAQHFSLLNLLSKANSQELIDITKQNVYDSYYQTQEFEEVNIERKYLHDTDGEIFHKVVSRGVYGDRKSLHDEISPEMFLKKIENLAYRNLIFKNLIDITVPGPGFIKSNGTVGDKIRISVLNDNTDPDKEELLDELRSGDFLVYNTRHVFRDTRHDVAMTIFKLQKGFKGE
jgi:hypothetical protein